MAVDFDGVEAVARLEEAKDFARDRPGAGADFEDARGSARPTQLGHEGAGEETATGDRKSTRLNSSHEWISYAVFCLKKKKKKTEKRQRIKRDNTTANVGV